jgi:hypothetical protein
VVSRRRHGNGPAEVIGDSQTHATDHACASISWSSVAQGVYPAGEG